MRKLVIGVLHPGEMGAAVAGALRSAGHDVAWASAGRSRATAARAGAAGLRDVGSTAGLVRECEVILSVCPPHAAQAVARAVTGYGGVYVDANAVSPATARAIGALVVAGGARFVDAGIIGPPPRAAGTTRLYLAGAEAKAIADALTGTALAAVIVSARPGDASAVKTAYAAWTKGAAALLLSARALAPAEGVEADLLGEWELSLPELREACVRAARSAATKGWRWSGEMDEIASAYAAAGLPGGFHRAAAGVFARSPRVQEAGDETLEAVLDVLAAGGRDGVTDSRR